MFNVRCSKFLKRQLNRATQFVEACAVTVGAGFAVFDAIDSIFKRALFIVFFGHPIEELSIAPTGGAPAAWTVPREMFRIEFWKGFASGWVGSLGG